MSIEKDTHPITEILPLAPLQEGLLFHDLYDSAAGNVYTVQTVFELEGEIDAERLRAATSALLARHTNLRAGFWHEGVQRPVQVIPSDIDAPWAEVDLTGGTIASRKSRLKAWLADDRSRSFVLNEPPLLRWALIHLSATNHRLVFTHHHLLLDGWSMPVLLRELRTLYSANGAARSLSPVTPYREYLAWVGRQDPEAARAAWRTVLEGLEAGTLPARRETAQCRAAGVP